MMTMRTLNRSFSGSEIMLAELFAPITDVFSGLRYGQNARTLTIAKPYCTPARDLITATFQQYGVKMFAYDEQVRMMGPRQAIKNFKVSATAVENVTRFLDPLPTAQVATVTVSEKQAAWAEYLLLRTGKLYCPNGYVNRRNAAWAAQHGGQMPPAWADNKPWIEKSCSEGKAAWAPLIKAAKGKR